jgi:type III pantothenate kinase
MILLVDIGNARLKWGSLIEEQFIYGGACYYTESDIIQVIETIWRGLPAPSAVYISNVAGEKIAQSVSQWLWQMYQLKPYFARAQRYCGKLINAYSTPQQLGVDRWMGLIAAWQQFDGPLCVIDCGTAITVDAVNQQGAHLGGLIVPGLETLKSALIKGTHGCREAEKAPKSSVPAGLLAQDTFHAVLGGAYYSSAAFINQITQDLLTEMGEELTCILTGGDAFNLSPLLAYSFKQCPYLVLEGLAMIANHRLTNRNFSQAEACFQDEDCLE